MLTPSQLTRIMPRVRDAALWSDTLNATMPTFEITSPPRIAAFLAQIAHESAELSRLVENLNYSAKGLRRTWPKRFKSDAFARRYERQPERIANYVYANRLGNGNEASGDGWRFRGRGILQITGRSNYASTGIALGLDLLADPDLLERPLAAARSAGLYWRTRGLNELADVSGHSVDDDEDFQTITRLINGGLAGLEDRIRYWKAAKKVLGLG